MMRMVSLLCFFSLCILYGHYDQGRDSECKAYNYYFYIQQFCQCLWSAWLHINTDFKDDDYHYDCDLLMMIILLWLRLSLLSVFSPLLGLWSWLQCQTNVDDNNEIGNVNGLIKLLMNGILCWLCRLMVEVVLNIVCLLMMMMCSIMIY